MSEPDHMALLAYSCLCPRYNRHRVMHLVLDHPWEHEAVARIDAGFREHRESVERRLQRWIIAAIEDGYYQDLWEGKVCSATIS